MRAMKRWCMRLAKAAVAAFVLLILATAFSLKPSALHLQLSGNGSERFQVLDRNGEPLGITYAGRFNTLDVRPLHAMPETLWRAFITAEDRQFFTHHGVDWQARVGAIWQNIHAGRKVRGASTITEQVVRILSPRPRSFWSRWVEGLEAIWLEQRHSKGEILAFYLNQVPYAANRRGVAQAARYYFDRDVNTLTTKEMLALAVLPRAPSALDLYRHPERIEPAISRLAQAMQSRNELSAEIAAATLQQKLSVTPPSPPRSAAHFIQYIRETVPYQLSSRGVLVTTLDANLQQQVQQLLDERLRNLLRKQVHNAAAIVADHRTGEILAYASASVADGAAAAPTSEIDAVRSARQPGSALKPFLYVTALELGWSPATILTDVPMEESIGSGLHDFRNYSRSFYGPISLREALGNSLNIPAIETIDFVTPKRYLEKLHALGFDTLTEDAEYYRDGLALGTGEVRLLDLTQAYAALANRGQWRTFTPLSQRHENAAFTPIFTEEAASLIGHILSDPHARRREFGASSVLNLPVQTAVKTGTSTDYRDAWIVGYNARYVVGVWMGNLDRSPMDGVTGSTGPALVMRDIMRGLNQRQVSRALYLSPKLVAKQICTTMGKTLSDGDCFPRTEYFIAGSESAPSEVTPAKAAPTALTIIRPTEGLHLAYDPRRPAALQAFEFSVRKSAPLNDLEWQVDGHTLATTREEKLLWPLERGSHTLTVIERDKGTATGQSRVDFIVK
jgi:penicillin-binding protein 1C